MISRRETMATSSSSSSSSIMFECSGGGCPRHRLPQITTCATCHQTLVDQVDSGGGDGNEVEGLNHRHHFYHHRRPRSSVNHHHNHHHDHHHHRPHQSSNCSSFVTGIFSPTVTSMSRQRATTTSTTSSSSSSTYPIQNSSSFSSSSFSSSTTCTKRTPRHSDHLLFSFSTSSSNDLLLTKLLHQWLPRVCLYLLTIRLLLSAIPITAASVVAGGQPKRAESFPLSSSSSSDLNSIASLFIKRSLNAESGNGDHHHHLQQHQQQQHLYMKPSQFFSRYFNCRYPLMAKKTSTDVVGGEHSFPEIAEPVVVTSSSSSSNTTGSIGNNWRHSKRQLSKLNSSGKRKRRPLSCPVDCDGVTKWPETAAGSVVRLNCLELLKTIQEEEGEGGGGGGGGHSGGHSDHHESSNFFTPSSTTPEMADEDQGDGDQIGTGSPPTPAVEDAHGGLLKLDVGGGGEVLQAEGYRLSEKKLASANATRRCSSEGAWELQADYSRCGLESRRLFALSPDLLLKIYEMREKMITSKYTYYREADTFFVECVDRVLSQPPSQLPRPFCDRTFDGWTCFNDTPAGDVVHFQCPYFVYGFNHHNQAHKTCTADGTWKVHSQTLVSWTNYSSCVDMHDFKFRKLVINFHIAGYSISLLALLISLSIFISFKSLSSQTRIRIHKNFFVSFIINNFMWIIWYFAITDQTMLSENGLYCQCLHVALHYFLLCNYFWMFCEGLYLHTILVVAFVSEEKILKWFYLIGWGIPAVFVAAYALLRGNSPDTANCWIDESKYTWILNVPVVMSFVLNIFFLINIVRVLITKLQAVNTADTHQTRKAVRATLILIPLLGLHFILTPFRPETNGMTAQVYEIFSALVSSLQGFAVAMLFCFFNGEVLSHIRKRWNQFLLVHGYSSASSRRMSYGGTTVSFLHSNSVLGARRESNNQQQQQQQPGQNSAQFLGPRKSVCSSTQSRDSMATTTTITSANANNTAAEQQQQQQQSLLLKSTNAAAAAGDDRHSVPERPLLQQQCNGHLNHIINSGRNSASAREDEDGESETEAMLRLDDRV